MDRFIESNLNLTHYPFGIENGEYYRGKKCATRANQYLKLPAH
jgi:hypothetical protein